VKKDILCGYCTREIFDAAECTESHFQGSSGVKFHAGKNRVLFNNKGRCTVQQFGNLAQARTIYLMIKREVLIND
jgi:hypothetical protein